MLRCNGKTIFSNALLKRKSSIFIQISQQFVRKGPRDNKSALNQVMGWRLTDNKPLHQPMLINMPDTTWHHWATMRLIRRSIDIYFVSFKIFLKLL